MWLWFSAAALVALLIVSALWMTRGAGTKDSQASTPVSVQKETQSSAQSEKSNNQSNHHQDNGHTGSTAVSGHNAVPANSGNISIKPNQAGVKPLPEVGTSNTPAPELAETLETAKHLTVDATGAGIASSAVELSNPGGNTQKLPLSLQPLHRFGGHWFAGFAVSQNQTGLGYDINPKYLAYVHKNFLSRMRDGESNLGALQFSGMAGYRVYRNLSVFAGVNLQQTLTRQKFSFTDQAPAVDMTQKLDNRGKGPIIGYLFNGAPVEYNGTSKTTVINVPVGIMTEYSLGKKWSVIPMLAANVGFLTQVTGQTLDYQILKVENRDPEWFRKTLMGVSGSVGAYRHLGYGLRWGVSAGVNGTATPVYNTGSTVRPRTWAAGLSTQLIWRID
ncbi:MAG: hypothetical protein JNL57_11585 [Bacteroidetes bacterium]|nr:hypothetical protein [Bacteroidota bacterium]